MKTALLLLLFSSSIIIGQNTCESKDETLIHLNNIDKCTIKKTETHTKNNRSLAVRITNNRMRFLKKRNTNIKLDSTSITK